MRESGRRVSTLIYDSPVPQIEDLFKINMFVYRHPRHNATLLRTTDHIALPPDLTGSLEFVAGLHQLPVLQSHHLESSSKFPITAIPISGTKSEAASQTSPEGIRTSQMGASPHLVQEAFGPPAVTPEVLKNLYNATGFDIPLPGSSMGSEGVAEWQWETFNRGDLSAFEKRNKLPEQQPRNVSGQRIGFARAEGTLDVQYIIAMSSVQTHQDGSEIPCDYWLSPGLGFDVLAWVSHVQRNEASPLVWSVSYGEALEAVKPAYAKRLNVEFQKLATLGVTVIFASGDSGVYSRTGGFDKFQPSFPACLPAVTAVGATQLDKDGSEVVLLCCICLTFYFVQSTIFLQCVCLLHFLFRTASRSASELHLLDSLFRAVRSSSSVFEMLVFLCL